MAPRGVSTLSARGDNTITVRTTRPEKCDILAQRYQSQPITTKFHKHCLYFLNHQKPCQNISLSEYFALCFKCCILVKTLSIRTYRTDKTVKPLIRLHLEEQSEQGLHCLSFYLLHLHIKLQREPKLFNFRIFSILISGVPILRGFHLKNVC